MSGVGLSHFSDLPEMLTLLIVVMSAKFGLSAHLSGHQNHGLQTVVLDTLYGPEHLKIMKDNQKSCSYASLKQHLDGVACKPRERIIPLGNEFIPNAIKVQRCSGMCELLNGECPGECQSLERRNVTHRAYQLKNRKKNCVSITIEEDVSCGCKRRMPQALVQNGKVWDKASCKFVCQKKPCTTGSVFDENNCRCVKKRRNAH